MITPQQFRNPQVKPKWQLSVGVMESVVAYNCRKYGFPRPVLAMPVWEGAGDRALDYSGHGNHGTLNGPEWDKNGLRLIDTDDDSITTNFLPATGSNPRSAFLIVNAPTIIEGDWSNAVLMSWGTAAFGGEWNLQFNATATGGVVGALRVSVNGGYKIANTGLSGKQDISIAYTFDGANVTDTDLYYNGQLETSSGSGARAINTGSSSNLEFGRNIQDTLNFTGHIFLAIFFDVALTAAQIKFLHENPYFMYQIPEELYGYVAETPPVTFIPRIIMF